MCPFDFGTFVANGHVLSRRTRPVTHLPWKQKPWEVVMGDTPDISSLSEFDFYEPVWYYEPGDFPEPKWHLARWLGEAMNIGQAMCYYILPASGVPIVRSSVQPL